MTSSDDDRDVLYSPALCFIPCFKMIFQCFGVIVSLMIMHGNRRRK